MCFMKPLPEREDVSVVDDTPCERTAEVMGAAPVVWVSGGADPPPPSASSPPTAPLAPSSPPAPSPAHASPEGCGPVPPVDEADVFPDRVLPGDLRPAVGSTGMPPAGADSSDDQRPLSKRSWRARSVSPPRGWVAECEVV
nr:SH3 domain-containing protein C23A1.17-like [Procambarus clarkii]